MKTQIKTRPMIRQSQTIEALTTRKQPRKPSRSTEATTEFGKSLKDLLGKTANLGEVNEEELFAATTHQLIKNRFGDGVAQDFKSAFKLNMADKPNGEKYPSAERATRESLKFFVNSTLITKEEAQQIRELAANLSQIDDNRDALWDSWGDTKAVTSFAKGQQLVQGRLEQSGNSPVTSSGRSQATMAAYGQKSTPVATGRRSRMKIGRTA